jgi:hypothetical protein
MRKLALLLALCPACSAPAAPARPGHGDLEGLSVAEAAERVIGRSNPPLTACERQCIEFGVAGCSNISDQCDDPEHHNFACVEEGNFCADCTTAKQLARGSLADAHQCVVDCGGWLGRVLNRP